jgi:hypothetical protein
MVAEDDDWPLELREERTQETFSAGMRHEVPGHTHDVWLSFDDPGDRTRACTIPTGESCAEVEVGEMADPETLQFLGEPGDRDVDRASAEPPSLGPAVGKYEHQSAKGKGDDGGHARAP